MKFLSDKFLVWYALPPVLIFFLVVIVMRVNVPYQDDFDGLLEPVLKLRTTDLSAGEFWKTLYTQDDERRIVMDRLTAFLLDRFEGSLDLRHIMMLGACVLLVFAVIVGLWFRSNGISWWFFLPVPWLLFTIQFYEAVFWAMIPLQHVAVFVWAFLSLWLLSRGGTPAFVAALLTGVMSVYSDVSGNFLIVAGAAVLMMQRRWQALVVWGSVMGIVVAWYFYGLTVPEYRPKFSDNLRQPLVLVHVLVSLFGLWADPGPGFPFGLRAVLAVLAGVAGIVLVAVLGFKKALQHFGGSRKFADGEAFVWGGLLFIAIVFGTLAVGRASEGVASVFNPRYRHMYLFWLIFVYMLLLVSWPELRRSKRAGRFLLVVSAGFWLNGYVQYWGALDRFRKILLTDSYEWFHNRALPSSPIYLALRERVDEIYEGAYSQGVYKGAEWKAAGLPDAGIAGNIAVAVEESADAVEIAIPEFRRGMGKDDGAYVILRAGEEIHILPAFHGQRPLHRILTGGGYYYPGARTERMVKGFLKAREFDIEVGVIEGEKQYRLETGSRLQL